MALGFDKASRHSTMRAWMHANRRQIVRELEIAARPDWAKIAQILDSHGLHDANGNPPKAQTARLTWFYLNRKKYAEPKQETVAPTVMPEFKPDRVAPVVNDDDATARRIANANNQIRRMK